MKNLTDYINEGIDNITLKNGLINLPWQAMDESVENGTAAIILFENGEIEIGKYDNEWETVDYDVEKAVAWFKITKLSNNEVSAIAKHVRKE